MRELSLLAPAKLNLFLYIVGRRPDGYHLLESLVVFTTLADVLHIAPAEGISLSLTGEFADQAGDIEHNLVVKAARLLQRHAGDTQGARLTLHKNIPVGAGLGGGSADAAAALRGLNEFWQLRLTPSVLHALAIQLGADVPMCLAAQPVIASGIGDTLLPISTALPPMFAVLVHPRIPLLTAEVYKAYQSGDAAMPWPPTPTDSQVFWAALARTRNHLQRPAISVNPIVAEILLALETAQPAPHVARMTGSGACCFGLYSDGDAANRAASAITKQHPQWWVRVESIQTNAGGV